MLYMVPIVPLPVHVTWYMQVGTVAVKIESYIKQSRLYYIERAETRDNV